MSEDTKEPSQVALATAFTARIVEYEVPPVKDALVLGRNAPIGCHAMRRALALLVKQPYVNLELEDEVISDILVREGLLRRLPSAQLIPFVLTRVRPLMGPEEVLHLEFSVEVSLSHRVE